MITDTIYKITIAGFFHDIGKFVQRAYPDFIELDFENRHSGLYLPYNKNQNRFTHKHALYTAAFIDSIEKKLPKIFNRSDWGLGDSFFNLAAGHHKPETSMQWLIAMADRISSGFERDEFEKYNNESDVKDFRKIQLIPVFEQISFSENNKDNSLNDYQFRYSLKELSFKNIFPERLNKISGNENDYKKLFDEFVKSIDKLEHKNCIPLWFEHFENCFMIYTSFIPASTVCFTDISLYDHSKATAALSAALYLYHNEKGTLNNIDKIKNYSENKFLIISGNFYGIQNFIFSEGSSTNKHSAKLLRGRSFYVSLLSELAADLLCRKIGLPQTSIILNAAGRFTIIAPNTDTAKTVIQQIEIEINDWLIRKFYGQTTIGISFIEVSPNDLVSKNLPSLRTKLEKELEEKKYCKINLDKYGGTIDSYLSSFKNNLTNSVCPFCGKHPSELELLTGDSICGICHDQIYIGTNLVKKNKLAITTKDANLFGEKLTEPIYDEYQLSFDVEGKLINLADDGSLLRYWDISISENGILSKSITSKFINGYVPKYSEEDRTEIDRLLYGEKSEHKKKELIDIIEIGYPKTLHHISKWALNEINNSGKFSGLDALGILKADIDNFGDIFSFGLKRQNLSKLATLSRQINNYFSIYLPYALTTNEKFKNIYTIYAGGDDLFLIGPWNKIIEFSKFLYETFSEYVCNNSEITISAGISIQKPDVPINIFYISSKEALEESKRNLENGTKNSITLFGETVKWYQFIELEKIKTELEDLLDKEIINNAMLFRLLKLSEMAKKEKEISKKTVIELKDMECLKWRSFLKYTISRNIGKNLKDTEKKEVIKNITDKIISWIDKYVSAIKIPVCQILYNKRGG